MRRLLVVLAVLLVPAPALGLPGPGYDAADCQPIFLPVPYFPWWFALTTLLVGMCLGAILAWAVHAWIWRTEIGWFAHESSKRRE